MVIFHSYVKLPEGIHQPTNGNLGHLQTSPSSKRALTARTCASNVSASPGDSKTLTKRGRNMGEEEVDENKNGESIKNGDLIIKNGLNIKNGGLNIKNGDLTITNGDLTIKNGDLTIQKMVV